MARLLAEDNGSHVRRSRRTGDSWLQRVHRTLEIPPDLSLGRLMFSARQPLLALPWPRLSAFSDPPTTVRYAPTDPWPGSAERGQAILQGRIRFGGETIDHPAPLWSPLGASEAWLGQLHGFAWLRDLRAAGGDVARRGARELTESWVERNRLRRGPGWEPSVCGERLANWLTHYEFYAASGTTDFRRVYLESACRQARYLHRVLPAGLAGADSIAAIKGLIVAAACLPGGRDWIAKGFQLLERELARQVLNDGGHIERSPARHVRVLRDLIDLRAVLHGAGIEAPDALRTSVQRLAAMLRHLRHGDGQLFLVNGSNEGEDWQIDVILQRAGGRKRGLDQVNESGFHRLQAGRTLVLVDAGAPPPPGFDRLAHAGTLSFELSVGRERLIVNCGAAPDRPEWRDLLRATAAHSTATLGDRNSSQILSHGQVLSHGGLGERPQEITSEMSDEEGHALLAMSHDGYLEPEGFVHQRRLYLAASGEDIRGEDRFEAMNHPVPEVPFAVRFHLHPEVRAMMLHEGNGIFLRTPKGLGWRFRSAGAALALEDSIYFGRPDVPRRTQQIVLSGTTDEATVVKWSFRREEKRR